MFRNDETIISSISVTDIVFDVYLGNSLSFAYIFNSNRILWDQATWKIHWSWKTQPLI